MSVDGRRYEEAILSLLSRRAEGLTICPSEAARVVDPQNWRGAMFLAHEAARSLARSGAVVLTQKGVVVATDAIQGVYRIRKA